MVVSAASYRQRSFWLDSVADDDPLTPRPSLTGDIDADVVVVGGGFTGLWTAYWIAHGDPSRRVVVLEADVCGYGASGRNGGWASALLPMSLHTLAARYGRVAAVAMQRAMHAAVEDIGRVCEQEGIDAHYAKDGSLHAATNPAHVPRLRAELDEARAFGLGDDVIRWLDRREAAERVDVPGLLGATFTPHCAAVHPARLVRGLARAAQRRGVTVHERTPVRELAPGRVRTDHGAVRAATVVRATEAFTANLPGHRRTVLPLYSLMVATEPLPPEVWARIGWRDRVTFADARNLIVYAQRTADGRIAFGGRGAPYHFGSSVRPAHDVDDRTHEALRRAVCELFPAAAGARFTHAWGGPLAVPRDWFCSVGLDRATGMAWAGGYVGDGVTTSHLAGRTLADLVLGHDTERTRLPWVGHRSRSWEPEPLRWIGVNAGRALAARLDRGEAHVGRTPRLSAALVRLLLGEVVMARPDRAVLGRYAAALGAGALVAAALPPWGWWPLAPAGIAVLDALIAGADRRARLGRGWVFGLGWIAPGTGWMWFLTAPGYVVVCLLFATMIGVAVSLVPPGRGRHVALVGALVLPEAARLRWPFGGVPLATLATGQAAGPLAPVARIGGVLALGLVTAALGVALAAAWRRSPRSAAGWVAVVVAAVLVGHAAPHGRVVGTRTIALVQGGGPQGARAVTSDARVVTERHLAATAALPADGTIDAVIWPENVIDVDDFSESGVRAEVAAEAARLGAPMVVGVTEEAGDDRFVNAQVVVTPADELVSRYEKVRRVPFGEYMPLRGFLDALGAPVDLVPRDAVAGTDPAFVDVPAATGAARGPFRAAVVISWEVFFGDRARDGVRNGGEVVFNPTNGSSYTGTVLQSQQIAMSRLRALETGRWVGQVSPTGFTAFVTPDGRVLDRTAQVEAAIRIATIELRRGLTPATRLGDWPWVLLAALLVGTGWLVAGRTSRPVSRVDPVAPDS